MTTRVEKERTVYYDIYDMGGVIASYKKKTDAQVALRNLKKDYNIGSLIKREVETITIIEEDVIF